MEYFGGAYIPGSPLPPVYGGKKPEEKKKNHWFKHLMFWLVLLFFMFGFALTLAEVVVRIVPGQWSNTFFHVYDPIVGTWHIPSHEGDYTQRDFTTKGITTNSFGMRDRERTIEKLSTSTIRIAVLGDSFVEAFHVADEETFTRVMEQQLGENVEVMNFGVAGFGTLQEYLTYEERVKQFHPDIVMLAFLSANDMRNNSRELEDLYTGSPNTDRPFPGRDGTSSWKAIAPVPKPYANNPYLLFVKKHFTLYRFLWYAKGMLQARFATVQLPPEATSTTRLGVATTTLDIKVVSSTTTTSSSTQTQDQKANVYIARLFTSTNDEPFKGAWDSTEWFILALKKAVEADGARFILLTLPDGPKLEPDINKQLAEEYGAPLPKGFDIDYPEKRLATFSKQNKITFFDLTPGFRKARDAENLKSPYFSWPHDGHWAQSGHKLAAQLIVEFLRNSRIIL